jgi:hypothetical protein
MKLSTGQNFSSLEVNVTLTATISLTLLETATKLT